MWMSMSRARRLAMGCAAVGLGYISPGTTIAAHIGVIKCSVGSCNRLLDLRQTARAMAVANEVPDGTTVLVSSDVYGLSGYFLTITGPHGIPNVSSITTTDTQMVELSQVLYAKSVAIEPIDIPPAIAGSAGNATYELVQGYVLSVLNTPTPAQTGYDFWNGLTNLSIGQVVYMVFIDSRDVPPTQHRVYGNDRITVRFADGSTAQLRMAGPMAPSGHFFVWVAGSERDANGEPFAGPSPPAATGTAGIIDLTPPWLGDILMVPSMSWCEVRATFCYGITGLDCSSRGYIVPCQ